MTQYISIGAVLLGLAALMFLAQGGAWLFTDFHTQNGLAPIINVRPFNCRACLTFWLTLVLLLGCAATLAPLTLNAALFAVIFAFINYFYIKTKITIYE